MSDNPVNEGVLIVLNQIQKTVDKIDVRLEGLVTRVTSFELKTDTRLTKLESKNDHRKENVSFVFSIVGALAGAAALAKAFGVL